jgi:hypothetical protein
VTATLVAPSPHLGLQIIRKDAWIPDRVAEAYKAVRPESDLGKFIAECLPYLPGEQAAELIERLTRSVVLHSSLAIRYTERGRRPENLGVVSKKVITTAGVGFLVDAWQNIVEMEIMKFHGCGTGTTAEASSDTALVTESTTILNPDNTRATGTLAEGASGNIFSTVGTVTFDGSGAIAEHMILSQAATGGGVGWDRSVFTAVNVASADSIQFTYQATASAGG